MFITATETTSRTRTRKIAKKKATKAHVKTSDLIVQVLTKKNPKRITSRAHKKFGILMKMDGKTVKQVRALEGKYPSLDKEAGWPSKEIRWSVDLGLVKLVRRQ